MKLNGARASHRNRWQLIQNGFLTIQEFSLFEYYIDMTDFDFRHTKFGLFEYLPEQIAEIFDKEVNTIMSWHRQLIKKKLIYQIDRRRSLFGITNPERYNIARNTALEHARQEKGISFQELCEIICQLNQKINQNIEKNKFLQPELGIESAPKAIGIPLRKESRSNVYPFSKGNNELVRKKVLLRQESRSDFEYKQIQSDGDYKYLTVEDMKWIDENVTETIEVKTDEQEKNAVDEFFDGDWENYKRHLITT